MLRNAPRGLIMAALLASAALSVWVAPTMIGFPIGVWLARHTPEQPPRLSRRGSADLLCHWPVAGRVVARLWAKCVDRAACGRRNPAGTGVGDRGAADHCRGAGMSGAHDAAVGPLRRLARAAVVSDLSGACASPVFGGVRWLPGGTGCPASARTGHNRHPGHGNADAGRIHAVGTI